MKKQDRKRLALHRETVHLMEQRLGNVLGGVTRVTCDNSCDTLVGSYCTCTNGPQTHCV